MAEKNARANLGFEKQLRDTVMRYNTAPVGELTNTQRYSVFKTGDLAIKFKTSPYLEHYVSILKWNNGYIECMAKYSTFPDPVEEYIDLRFIADRLQLPKDIFQNIKEVSIK